MPLRVDDPRDIQGSYNHRFNDTGELSSAEQTGDDSYVNAGIDQAESFANDSANKDAGKSQRLLQNSEQSNQPSYLNKFTGGTKKNLAKNLKGKIKQRAAIGVVTTIIGAIASILPFMGASSLPFAILGNIDVNSALHGIEQYSMDYYGFSIFHATDKASVASTGSKLKGLTTSEIKQLEKNGVEFKGGKRTPTGRMSYSAVRINGRGWIDAKGFNKEMLSNPAFRKAMIYDKKPYWKSARSAVAAGIKERLKLNPNPDIDGKNAEERDKKILAESTEGTDPKAKSGIGEQKDKDGKDINAAERKEAERSAGELNKAVEEQKTKIKSGDLSGFSSSNNMANLGMQYGKEGMDLDVAKSLGGKIWSYANPLDVADTVCTVYQTAQTANTLARTVALVNIVRYGIMIRTVFERTKAEGLGGESTQYLIKLLQKKDPVTGQSFDSSSYAAFLFNGTLSSEPDRVSAFGGAAMVSLYMTMHGIHGTVGQLFSGLTLGAVDGTAANGRKILRDGCKVATNLGVQAGALVGELVIGAFTGGTAIAGEQAAKTAAKAGIKAGVKALKEKFVKKFGKEAIEKILKKKSAEIGEKGFLRTMAKESRVGFKKLYDTLEPWDRVGLLVAGVSTFGMGYIVNSLSGGNIVECLKNGVTSVDCLGTAVENTDSRIGISSGGTAATYQAHATYESDLKKYQDAYVADLKYEQKDTPFNIGSPYSTLGSAIFAMQKTIGVSNSLNSLSTLTSIAALPLRIPSVAFAADKSVTPEAIGDKLGNPTYISRKMTTGVTGSLTPIFKMKHSFEEVVKTLLAEGRISIEEGDKDTRPVIKAIDSEEDENGLNYRIKKCHDKDKQEPDPEFQDDDGNNAYDFELCAKGTETYKKNDDRFSLLDDAAVFINLSQPTPPSRSVSLNNATSATTPSQSEGTPSGDLSWPLDKKLFDANRNDWLDAHRISSGSWTNGTDALAADISVPEGTPVYAIAGGTVTRPTLHSSRGGPHGLAISSNIQGGVLEIAYAHGSRVNQNTTYKAGDLIMMSGCLGYCLGAHLHLDIAFNGKGICPQDIFIALQNNQSPDFNTLAAKASAPCAGRI